MPRSRSVRRRTALLAILTLTASLAVPIPATAAVDTSFSCPANLPSAGFTDIGGLDATTQRAIDCLAVHDITHGTGPTTFNPGGSVPRWQMALFLIRQAEAHNVILPDGADQGFTDLSGLSAEAILAVNRLAQLDITKGTSITEFSPYEPVTRWQMALFVTRLLAAGGIALPSPSDQGFADLGGVSSEAVTAIEQLAVLGVAEGTSATTFEPGASTLRWHMALFLTRTLSVAGVLPPGVSFIVISPTDGIFLDFNGTTVARSYLLTVGIPGPVTVELWPASAFDTNGAFVSDAAGLVPNCDITMVDGVTRAADKVSGINPSAVTVGFTVGCSGTQQAIVPVVYTGDSVTGISGASTAGPKVSTNDGFALGGAVTVVDEASAGAFGPVTVGSLDKTDNWFTVGGVTYFFDTNDAFKIGGTAVTMGTWEAALSAGDTLLIGSDYSEDPTQVSTFDLDDVAPAAPALSLVSAASSSATFTYAAAAGADLVKVYLCAGTGCATSLTRVVPAGTDEDSGTSGTQFVLTGLSSTTDYDVQVSQVEDGDEGDKSTAVDVDTLAAVSITSVSVQDVNDGTGTWTGLVVSFDKNVVFDAGASLSDVQIYASADPGTRISSTVLANGPDPDQLSFVFPSQNDTSPDTDWVVAIAAGALDVGAGGDPNEEVTAPFSH